MASTCSWDRVASFGTNNRGVVGILVGDEFHGGGALTSHRNDACITTVHEQASQQARRRGRGSSKPQELEHVLDIGMREL